MVGREGERARWGLGLGERWGEEGGTGHPDRKEADPLGGAGIFAASGVASPASADPRVRA